MPGSLLDQDIGCPHCSAVFHATPPERNDDPSEAPPLQSPIPPKTTTAGLPEKLPFFKFSRRKLLEKRLSELTADGELDKSDSSELDKLTAGLGLDAGELSAIRKKKAVNEFEAIRKRAEKSMWVTDADLDAISRIGKKFDLNIKVEGFMELFRAIYLIEAKHELPDVIPVRIPLKSKECCYFKVETTWQQPRVQTRGYSGTTVSIPSGIKGVRFRVGSSSPVRSEEITPLASGTVYITSGRIVFIGDSRSTTVPFGKIMNCEAYADAVKIEKETGRPDFFAMNAAQSRFVAGLLSVLTAGSNYVHSGSDQT